MYAYFYHIIYIVILHLSVDVILQCIDNWTLYTGTWYCSSRLQSWRSWWRSR